MEIYFHAALQPEYIVQLRFNPWLQSEYLKLSPTTEQDVANIMVAANSQRKCRKPMLTSLVKHSKLAKVPAHIDLHQIQIESEENFHSLCVRFILLRQGCATRILFVPAPLCRYTLYKSEQYKEYIKNTVVHCVS